MPGMAMHVFRSSTWETEESLVSNEFQISQGYTVRLFQKKNLKKHTAKLQTGFQGTFDSFILCSKWFHNTKMTQALNYLPVTRAY